jgi:nucleotide-binding universal stress UspA family protein
MFKKVLVATDILENHDPVVLNALEFAKKNEASLYILHVLESFYSGHHREFVIDFRNGKEVVATAEYREAIKEILDKAYSDFLKPYGSYEIKVTAGYPYMEILKWAREKDIDLIITGPHSRRAEERGVARTTDRMGSTVQAVVMRARCPVMIINKFVPKEKFDFKKVIVCQDFSESCRYACEFALKLAQKYNTKLYFFPYDTSTFRSLFPNWVRRKNKSGWGKYEVILSKSSSRNRS